MFSPHLLSVCLWCSINTLIGATFHLTVIAVSLVFDRLILNSLMMAQNQTTQSEGPILAKEECQRKKICSLLWC